MDAISFSVNEEVARMEDLINHLNQNNELYFEIKYRIKKNHFTFPMWGYMHISGRRVEYRATIKDIIMFDKEHYENPDFALKTKPPRWRWEWETNYNNIRNDKWKYEYVITKIDKFIYDTYSLKKLDGSPVSLPPKSYVRILPP